MELVNYFTITVNVGIVLFQRGFNALTVARRISHRMKKLWESFSHLTSTSQNWSFSLLVRNVITEFKMDGCEAWSIFIIEEKWIHHDSSYFNSILRIFIKPFQIHTA